ncbi:MAG: Mut7-C RNAse domain-containing protein [Anaerolineae bacterium]|nr:Mut7-C RNAse domain-containing protein [Anaerolineae bacterium]MDW8101897.1 Mut7-C RNAse domain-containing protein [Anaerolineae bacterium]
MKFIADSMLGSLAKWLRILGYDTLYFPHLDDDELAYRAMAEERVLLTRDQELARRRGVRALLIKSSSLEEQLLQVFKELGLETRNSFSRCPICNEPLNPVNKESVREKVPLYVFQTHEHFSACPTCHRIYWRGSHWQRMKECLDKLTRS